MADSKRKPVGDSPKPGKPSVKYRALVGLDLNGKSVEAGDVVSDIPEKAVEWLLKNGRIEKVED